MPGIPKTQNSPQERIPAIDRGPPLVWALMHGFTMQDGNRGGPAHIRKIRYWSMLWRLFLNTRTFKQLKQINCTRSSSSGIGPPNFKTSGSFVSVPRLPSSPPFQPSSPPAFQPSRPQPSSPPAFQPSLQPSSLASSTPSLPALQPSMPAFQFSSLPALQPSSLPEIQPSTLPALPTASPGLGQEHELIPSYWICWKAGWLEGWRIGRLEGWRLGPPSTYLKGVTVQCKC